jgi:hypothetical protein
MVKVAFAEAIFNGVIASALKGKCERSSQVESLAGCRSFHADGNRDCGIAFDGAVVPAATSVLWRRLQRS